ncbi:hypothetical protein JXD38_12080 [candidate division WOR-3 bacterium]|nr:hypothetical protein [candidate division WOR-3 bacterium]
MKAKTVKLVAAPNDVDRRLVNLAIRSSAYERAATDRSPTPLAFWGQKARLMYKNGLKERERRLRALAAELEGWRLHLRLTFKAVPVQRLYRRKGVVPPSGIRALSTRNDFHLVQVSGRFAVSDSTDPADARLALRFSTNGRSAALKPAVHSFFPKAGLRRYGATDVLVGLRSTLRFWVAAAPDGTLIEDRDRIPEPVCADLVYGPVKYRFGKTRAAGAGNGRPMLEWYFAGASLTDGAKFDNMVVLRTAQESEFCTIGATLGVNLKLPTGLQPLLGRNRVIRDSRTLALPVTVTSPH